ncbi:MAG TPA: hypothetical protein PKJ41_12830 [Bryobacteraceae bacterium]|nr:hypothetical protein [Bryobacteraceae bacterium]
MNLIAPPRAATAEESMRLFEQRIDVLASGGGSICAFTLARQTGAGRQAEANGAFAAGSEGEMKAGKVEAHGPWTGKWSKAGVRPATVDVPEFTRSTSLERRNHRVRRIVSSYEGNEEESLVHHPGGPRAAVRSVCR